MTNKKEALVKVSDYYLDGNTRNTTISSRHCSIIRGLRNASDKQILEIRNSYIQYEKEYANPINKVKRLLPKKRR